MKIIKKGSIPEQKKPWWQRIIITCEKCDTQYQLEEGDQQALGGQLMINPWVQCYCPICRKSTVEEWNDHLDYLDSLK